MSSRESGGRSLARCRRQGSAGRPRLAPRRAAPPRPLAGTRLPRPSSASPCGPPPFDSGAGRSGLQPRRRALPELPVMSEWREAGKGRSGVSRGGGRGARGCRCRRRAVGSPTDSRWAVTSRGVRGRRRRRSPPRVTPQGRVLPPGFGKEPSSALTSPPCCGRCRCRDSPEWHPFSRWGEGEGVEEEATLPERLLPPPAPLPGPGVGPGCERAAEVASRTGRACWRREAPAQPPGDPTSARRVLMGVRTQSATLEAPQRGSASPP